MKTTRAPAFVNTSAGRQNLIAAALALALPVFAALSAEALAADDPLPSWNGGPARGNRKRGTN